MKFNRFLILFLVFFLTMLVWVWFSFYVVSASTLRDFQNTAELEMFLELTTVLSLKPDNCAGNVDAYIKASSLNGYKVERYRIASPDYYRYWYNEDLKPNEAHGVALVVVNGKDYLIEPSIPMAWELDKPYAGKKVDTSWQ